MKLLCSILIQFWLTQVLSFSRPQPSDYAVTSFEDYGIPDEFYAGLMPLKFENNNEGALFFWLAKQRQTSASRGRNLVIWLNGGPGCSSMTGMMWENGPFTIHNGDSDEAYKLKYNPYSWNEVADVLFVEQPIRAGFSPAAAGTRIIRTEHEVAQDFHHFLLSFLEVFKEFQGVPVTITGESYAGAYIPSMAEYIVQTQLKSGSKRINLAGVAIGNGVMDFLIQTPAYAEYAYYHGLIPLGAKQRFDRDFLNCLEKVEASGAPLNRGAFTHCNLMGAVLKAAGSPNQYDTRTFVQYDGLMLPDGAYHRFFNDPKIQEILHVRGHGLPGVNFYPERKGFESESLRTLDSEPTELPPYESQYYVPDKWIVCNNVINTQMELDHPTTTVPSLQFLAKYIRVFLYSGEADLNCNTLGTLHTLEQNMWLGRSWDTASRSLWRFKDDVAGEYFAVGEKSAYGGGDAFAFLIIRNSGHLLPMDVPDTALEMLRRFLAKESFVDVILPTEASYLDPKTYTPIGEDEAAMLGAVGPSSIYERVAQIRQRMEGPRSSESKVTAAVLATRSSIDWMVVSAVLLVCVVLLAKTSLRAPSPSAARSYQAVGVSSTGERYGAVNRFESQSLPFTMKSSSVNC